MPVTNRQIIRENGRVISDAACGILREMYGAVIPPGDGPGHQSVIQTDSASWVHILSTTPSVSIPSRVILRNVTLDDRGYFGLDDPMWFPQRFKDEFLCLAWLPKPPKDPYETMDHPAWLIPSFHLICQSSDFEESSLPHLVQLTSHRADEVCRAHKGLTDWIRGLEGAITNENVYLADPPWRDKSFYKHWNQVRELAIEQLVWPATMPRLVFVYGVWQRATRYTYGFVRYLQLWKNSTPLRNFELPYYSCMGTFVDDADRLDFLVRQRMHAILAINIPENDEEFQNFTLKAARVEHRPDNGTAAIFGGGKAARSWSFAGTPLVSKRFNFAASAKLPWQTAVLPPWCRWYGLDCPRVDNSPLVVKYSFEEPPKSNAPCKKPMGGQFALIPPTNWHDAVSPMVDVLGQKVKEGAIARFRAGYIVPHPDSLSKMESHSSLAYFLLHTIRCHGTLVSFIKRSIQSTSEPAVDGRYRCHLRTVKTWKSVFNVNIAANNDVAKLREELDWDPPAATDNTTITWENEGCGRAGALHSDNIKALSLPRPSIVKGVLWFFAEVNFRLDFIMLDEMEAERYDYSRVERVMLECFGSPVWEASENDIYFSLFSNKSEHRHYRLLAFYRAMSGWKSVMNTADRAPIPAYDPANSEKYIKAAEKLEQWIANTYCLLFFKHFGRAASIPYRSIFRQQM